MIIRRIENIEEISSAITAIDDVVINLEKRVSLSEYIKKLANYSFCFVLEDDEEVKGFASMYANDMLTATAYISLIACNKNSRHAGYGTKMFNYLVNFAKERDMKSIKLEVDKDNERAISFYKKLGLTFAGETDDTYYMQIDLSC